MNLTLSPMAGLPGEPETTVHVAGDVLTLDGVSYDLSAVPEGGQAEAEGEGHPFRAPITRTDGVLHAVIGVRYDAATAEDDQPADPAHWIIENAVGEIDLPIIRRPIPEPAASEEKEGEGDDVQA